VQHWTRLEADNDVPPRGRPPIPGGLKTVGLLENREKLGVTATPTLVMHGDDDCVVPLFQAELSHQASAAPSERKTLVRFPGRGHNNLTSDPEYWPVIAKFLDQVLGIDASV